MLSTIIEKSKKILSEKNIRDLFKRRNKNTEGRFGQGDTKNEKEDEAKVTKRMPRTGRNREGVIGAGKNSCAGNGTTKWSLFVSKILSLQKALKTFKCVLYNNQYYVVRLFFVLSKCSLLTKDDLLNLSIFFIVVENFLGFWQEIVEQQNKMQEILEWKKMAFSINTDLSKLDIPTNNTGGLWHKSLSHTACWANRSDLQITSGMKRFKLQEKNRRNNAHTCWNQDLVYFYARVSGLTIWDKCFRRQECYPPSWLESHSLHCLSPAPKQDTKSLGTN